MDASSKDQQPGQEIALHPIQLEFVAVRELFVKTFRALPYAYEVSPDDIHIQAAAGDYNSETKRLQIDVRVYSGDDPELSDVDAEALAEAGKLLFQLRAHIVGQYTVDDENFPMDLLESWTQKGGAMTLFPYVREHVYALTSRCGIRPVILPIMQMPTIKIAAPVSTPEPATAASSN